jgi:gas vesicle protein
MIMYEGENKMIHANQEHKYPTNNVPGVFIGMLIGGLAGAVTALLMAPQSGKDTRKQIKEKSIELRDRTTELVEDTMTQVRTNANKLTEGLKDRGQEIAVKQLDQVANAAQAGKEAIQSSR